MAIQETGTEILARARIFAQDNDANSNYAVSAADALILLNDVLVSLSNNVRVKPKWIAATTTGLTFASGDTSALMTISGGVPTEVESFHQSASSSLTYPISPAIERVSVQEMLELLQYDGTTALSAQAADWTHVAAEKSQSDTAVGTGVEKWRVWGFPVINRTRHMTIRAPMPVTIATIGLYPELDTVDSRVVSRLLAYEIARLKKDTSQGFLDGILTGVPKNVLPSSYGGALRSSQLQDRIVQVFQ